MYLHTLSMEASAKEARFEVTEEFARDAYRGLEDFKDSVERELQALRCGRYDPWFIQCVFDDVSTFVHTFPHCLTRNLYPTVHLFVSHTPVMSLRI